MSPNLKKTAKNRDIWQGDVVWRLDYGKINEKNFPARNGQERSKKCPKFGRAITFSRKVVAQNCFRVMVACVKSFKSIFITQCPQCMLWPGERFKIFKRPFLERRQYSQSRGYTQKILQFMPYKINHKHRSPESQVLGLFLILKFFCYPKKSVF